MLSTTTSRLNFFKVRRSIRQRTAWNDNRRHQSSRLMSSSYLKCLSVFWLILRHGSRMFPHWPEHLMFHKTLHTQHLNHRNIGLVAYYRIVTFLDAATGLRKHTATSRHLHWCRYCRICESSMRHGCVDERWTFKALSCSSHLYDLVLSIFVVSDLFVSSCLATSNYSSCAHSCTLMTARKTVRVTCES